MMEVLKVRENFILECVALTGDFPISLLSSFPGAYSWTVKSVRKLRQEKLIRIYDNEDCKSLRLTQKGKKLLLAVAPDRFSFLTDSQWQKRSHQSKLTARFRTHLLGETYLFLLGTKTGIFPDEKPPLESLMAQSPLDTSVFYSSLELKSFGNSPLKIRSSRATGLLLFKNRRGFLTFQATGDTMRWSELSERKMKGYATALMGSNTMDGILLASEEELLIPYLESTGGKNHLFFSLTDLFPSFYFVPTTENGKKLFSLLQLSTFEQKMKHYYLKGATVNESHSLTAHGWISDRPLLLAWNLDMIRLQSFKESLLHWNIKGIILCFDWQRTLLENYFFKTADVRVIEPL